MFFFFFFFVVVVVVVVFMFCVCVCVCGGGGGAEGVLKSVLRCNHLTLGSHIVHYKYYRTHITRNNKNTTNEYSNNPTPITESKRYLALRCSLLATEQQPVSH